MKYEHIGVKIPKILLPNTDLHKWAVVACDQYTSEPEYWKAVEELVGDEPSTLKLIFPEVYLKEPNKDERINNINNEMQKYLDNNLTETEGIIYVERTVEGKTRQGLVLALDLEKYDYTKGSKSLIRATEGTIVDRLPPRIQVRKNAPIELPHIMVLIDDPLKKVIEPLKGQDLELVYDFELMMNGGHIKGFRLNEEVATTVLDALVSLTEDFKYDSDVLLFAMGDGNHSLATAKAIWEETKKEKGMDHPSRYALVELVNIHSDAIVFEPIHRAVFDAENIIDAMKEKIDLKLETVSKEEMIEKVNNATEQTCGYINSEGYHLLTFINPESTLTYATLQNFLNEFGAEVDYIHGTDVICELGKKHDAFFMAPIDKNSFFKSVVLDGALPRKTFSMGEAHEKRFYLEGRRIS